MFVMQGGVIRMTYAALEHMNKLSRGQGGVVVNTSSLAGTELSVKTIKFSNLTLTKPLCAEGIEPLSSCPAYSATKHGVVAFTRAMAVSMHALFFTKYYVILHF